MDDIYEEVLQPDRSGAALAKAHGWFNVVSGLWPILHLRSFEAVSGEKKEEWLVKAVAGLLVAVGAMQIRERNEQGNAEFLGVTAASALLAVDLVYVPKRRMPKVYLLDALLHAGWISAWALRRRAVRAGARLQSEEPSVRAA